MHPRKIITSALLLLATTYSNAQYTTVDFSSSLGTANYFGDLNSKSSPYIQTSFSGSVGLVYYFADKFNLRADIGYSQLKGDDKKSNRDELKARNLNFRSNTTNLNLCYNQSQFANQGNSPQHAVLMTSNSSSLFIKERKPKKVSHREDFKKYSVFESYDQTSTSNFNASGLFANSNYGFGTNTPNVSNLASNMYLPKDANNNSRDLEVIPENSNLKTFHTKVLDEKDHQISDYRVVKDVYLDQIGNTIYKLERINRIEQERQKKNNKIFCSIR